MTETVGIDYACYGHWGLAAKRAGLKVSEMWQPQVYDSAADRNALEIAAANFRIEMRTPDQWETRPNYIVGSPPCIGFSGANPKAGPDHPANINFLRFFEDVAKVRPDHFVVEICEPVFTRGAKILANAQRLMTRSGYNMAYKVFNVEEHGSPSIRRRPYFVGSRIVSRPTLEESLSIPRSKETACRQAIGDLTRKWDNAKPDNIMLMSKYTDDGRRRHGPFRTLTDHRRELDPDAPAPTVTGFLCESVFHYSKERLLAIPEIMRLMGFPDNFKLNPNNRRMNAVKYCKMIASGVQIDFTAKLLQKVVKTL